MNLTGYEIQQLQHMTHVFRNDCERKLRRIRRNRQSLQAQYDEMPDWYIEDNAIMSPQEEIDHLRIEKAEAVAINKKLQVMKVNAIKNGEWNK